MSSPSVIVYLRRTAENLRAQASGYRMGGWDLVAGHVSAAAAEADAAADAIEERTGMRLPLSAMSRVVKFVPGRPA